MPTGACIPPASLASRTSRDGRAARRTTSSPLIALVAQDAAGDPDDPRIRAGSVEDGLGGRRPRPVPNAIAVGPTSSGLSAVADGVIRGDPHQSVLDDAIRHVLLAQGAPDLGDLLDLEAAVLGDDHRPSVGEFLAQLGDRLAFGLRGHMPAPSSTQPACGGGPRPSRSDGPCDVPWRPSLRVDPTRRGAAHPEVERRRSASACSSASPAGPEGADPVRRIKSRPPPTPVERSAGAGCLRRFVCLVGWRASRPSPRLVTGGPPVGCG